MERILTSRVKEGCLLERVVNSRKAAKLTKVYFNHSNPKGKTSP